MRRVAAALLAALLVGACAFGEIYADYGDAVDLQTADVIGTWHSGAKRSFTFAANGEFSARGLPAAEFADFVDGTVPTRIDGSGTWSLERAGSATDSPHATVALTFTRLAGEPTRSSGPDLSALRQDNGKVFLFFFYVGPGGNSWTSYEKCPDGSTETVCRPAPRPPAVPRAG